MFYVYCVVVVLLMFGYQFIMNRLDDEGVEKDNVFAPNLTEMEMAKVDRDVFGVLLFVPKVVDEPKSTPKPDLREQYRIWIENARAVNESYQREGSLRMRGSA